MTLAGGALLALLVWGAQLDNPITRAVDRWFEARHKE